MTCVLNWVSLQQFRIQAQNAIYTEFYVKVRVPFENFNLFILEIKSSVMMGMYIITFHKVNKMQNYLPLE